MPAPSVTPLLIAALAVVVSGGAGVALGLSGLVSAPTTTAGTIAEDARTASASDCAGGPAVATLDSGDRVVAVARSDDGDWIGVRSPEAPSTLWLPIGMLTLDEGEPDPGSLPVGGACPEVVSAPVGPSPVDPTDPDPDPAPGADTTAPTLGVPTVSPTVVACDTGIGYPESTSVGISANDDRDVTAVRISWSGAESGSGNMLRSGSTWTFEYNPGNSVDGTVTFSIVASDAAGNDSTPRNVPITVECLD